MSSGCTTSVVATGIPAGDVVGARHLDGQQHLKSFNSMCNVAMYFNSNVSISIN